MNSNDPIKTICIVGGTHGNELSGVQAVGNWQQEIVELAQDNDSALDIQFYLANKDAINKRVRYVDEDLNRQFNTDNLQKLADLNQDKLNNEQLIASTFNEVFGPKGEPKTDLIIDIHNTTSNMGPTLIILENDEFHQQLARFVKLHMPQSVILVEDYQKPEDFGYLCTVAKRGLMVEVGPQAHSTLKADIYNQAIMLCNTILAYVTHYNAGSLQALPAVEAFRLGEEIAYPTKYCEQSKKKIKTAMIHPNLEGKDYQLLKTGAPCFVGFNGTEITWQGEDTYPHFIGEAAYNHLNIAFATASKCLF